MEAFEYNWQALKPRFGAMKVADIMDDACRDDAQERLAVGRIIR